MLIQFSSLICIISVLTVIASSKKGAAFAPPQFAVVSLGNDRALLDAVHEDMSEGIPHLDSPLCQNHAGFGVTDLSDLIRPEVPEIPDSKKIGIE
jgi:hypothetical protein